MRVLDKKLWRDFLRLWPQALAVALVLSCGVATLILSIGSYRSLDETRQAYYERYRFASVFASATRAPLSVAREISHFSGVTAVEPRIVQSALLDIPGMKEPATGQVISIPDYGKSLLNQLYLKAGRMPEADKKDEIVVSANFAEAHGFRPGSTFAANVRGRRVNFQIVGLVLSPEFIYAVGPGDFVPDYRRFAVIWMRNQQLADLTDQDGAFNSISLSLLPGISEADIIQKLDQVLRPFGGTGAYGRKDQFSHAFLDSELQQLSAMAKVIPPIFLFVSAFLVNMILSRLIALEREQIGLLKALGYGRWSIAGHYMKLVLIISAFGVAIGFAAGTWLGDGLTRLYAEFFNFPFLVFRRSMDVYALAASVTVAAALLGAFKSVQTAASLPPAAAMRPASPPQYRRASALGQAISNMFSQLSVMSVRHMTRWPLRSGMTMLGSSLAVALLVTALFMSGSVNTMIDILFFQTERQDATVTFSTPLSPSAVFAMKQLPGILSVEPFRVVQVELTNGSRKRRLSITGKPDNMRLSRVLDLELKPVELPSSGLILTERVAHHLDAKRGDILDVKLLEEGWYNTKAPVVDIVQSFVGLGAYMDLAALDRLSRIGPRRSGVYVEIDAAKLDETYKAIKLLPAVASIGLQATALQKFRETLEKNISTMTTVYIVLAVIIAFGVVYNSARIQLSERARELASLRVLGFTKREVSSVLIIELAVIALLAQPLGWALGYGFAWAVISGFQNDLFRLPFVMEASAFGWASIVVLAASAVSALIVLTRVQNLDMIRVLKTKE